MTPNTQKNLYGLIRACQRGQHVAIVGSTNDDNQLRNDLYIPQPEDKKVTNFFADDYEKDGKLLVLTGSAGDGKSALLSRGYDACVTDLPKERINMDATAARARTGEYTERLDEFFSTVIPDVRASDGPRSGLAINYGLAVDYFERQAHSTSADAGEVWDALRESQTAKEVRTDNVHVINLSHRRTYNSHPDQLGAGLVRQLLDRFDPTTKDSPFTTAYEHEQDHCPAGVDCPLLYNVNQLTDENTKDNIARVLAGWSIARGAYLNPRTIIDYISSMVLPTAMHDVEDHSSCPIGAAIAADRVDPTAEMLLWNAVFKQLGTMSAVEESRLDPASHTGLETDQEILSWGGDQTDDAFANCAPSDEFAAERAAEIRTVLRSRYLTAGEGTTELDEKSFQEFVGALTYFQNDVEELRSEAQNFVQTTKQALSNWTGRKQDSELVEFVDGERSTDYRFLSPWQSPGTDPEKTREQTKQLAVPGRIKLMMESTDDNQETIPIPLVFETYRLMKQISRGYTPNTTDLNRSHTIQMLHTRLADFTAKREKVIVENRAGTARVTVQEGDLGFTLHAEGIE